MTTKCPACGYEPVPDGARFCPSCGKALEPASQPDRKTEISVKQDVGNVADSQVTGVNINKVGGNVTVDSTVNHIEAKIIQGQYVDRQTITQNVLVLGPEALDQITKKLAAMQGVDKTTVQKLDAHAVPENVRGQIVELMAAQRDVSTKGVATTPQAAYNLGMLAAYSRQYEMAMDYFRQATQADPELVDAFETIAWLQQSRANDFLRQNQVEAAVACLAEARTAAMHTDPLDPQAMAQRGYIAKTLAQVADARHQKAERDRYYEEAVRMFIQAAKLDPNDPSAQNGLGNVQYARGELDAAITAYQRALDLAPTYTAALHDLALAYEGKMHADPANSSAWRLKALDAWQKTYALAPQDPGFSADYILTIGQRINWLQAQK